MKTDTDVAIIGGGCAGLAAAMYAGRLGLNATVFDDNIGGTIQLTDIVENYPGFKKLTGMALVKVLKVHAEVYNPKFIEKKVKSVKKVKSCFELTVGDKVFTSHSIILAAGTKWRHLGVPGEKEFEKKGVFSCALCDGPLYRDKIVAVVGGADSAAKEALTLSGIAKKVYIIYRGDKIRPEPINMERVEAQIKKGKVEIINNTNVLEFIGKDMLEKVKLDKKYKNSNELNLDAVFVDVGHIPLTKIAKDLGVKLNKKGEVIKTVLMETNLPGFFVAGDCSDTPFKQAIISTAEGSTAAYSAYQYVTQNPLCTKD